MLMRTRFLARLLVVLIVLFCSLNLWAADDITPLNIKEGLWEDTVTRTMKGIHPHGIPPDLSPEDRARAEATMKGEPVTDVRKNCVTKEKLEKHSAFNFSRGDCTRTVVSSTGSKLELKFHCEISGGPAASDGTLALEALSSDNVKGTMHSITSGRPVTTDLTFTSKYLGPDCGDVK
jgi:hypothetical protein